MVMASPMIAHNAGLGGVATSPARPAENRCGRSMCADQLTRRKTVQVMPCHEAPALGLHAHWRSHRQPSVAGKPAQPHAIQGRGGVGAGHRVIPVSEYVSSAHAVVSRGAWHLSRPLTRRRSARGRSGQA
jgi:hypothetical protein